MENAYFSIFNFLVDAYNSQAFVFLKFLLGIYLLVIIIDIILLTIARGINSNIRHLLYGIDLPIEFGHKKKVTRKKWNTLKLSLESEKENDWKVMIIKADEMIFNLIRKLGHKEKNMGEALENINENQINGIDKIREAHEIRNRIIHEDDFRLSKEEAMEVMKKYESFLLFFDV